MAGRYDFQSRFGGASDPWFTLGGVDVTTTIGAVGVGLMSIIVWAIEGSGGPITRFLRLEPESVARGQIWRLVTWPIMNGGGTALFWTLLLLAIFFMLGSQLEAVFGKEKFLAFLLYLTVVPAVIVSLLAFVMDLTSFIHGLRMLELGVLVAFAAQMPTARFWPGIPAPALAGIIILIEFFQLLGNRAVLSTQAPAEMIMLFSVIATGIVGLRAAGHGDALESVPRLPLPGLVDGTTISSRPSRPQRPRKRNRAGLRSVPTGGAAAAPRPTAAPTPAASAEIDAILDQISEQGYDSLTREQRTRLEAHSKQMRQQRDS